MKNPTFSLVKKNTAVYLNRHFHIGLISDMLFYPIYQLSVKIVDIFL